jgi:CcmD family protein
MNSAGSIKFLYAAYTATWVIHVAYIVSLVRRFGKLREQRKELGKGSGG